MADGGGQVAEQRSHGRNIRIGCKYLDGFHELCRIVMWAGGFGERPVAHHRPRRIRDANMGRLKGVYRALGWSRLAG